MKLSFKKSASGSFSRVWWYKFPGGKPQRILLSFPVATQEARRYLKEKFKLKRLPVGTLVQVAPIL